jgi:hypothetical protein
VSAVNCFDDAVKYGEEFPLKMAIDFLILSQSSVMGGRFPAKVLQELEPAGKQRSRHMEVSYQSLTLDATDVLRADRVNFSRC